MGRSRWWVLLVLATFFTMHGIECAAGHAGAVDDMSTDAMALTSSGAGVQLAPSVVDHPTVSTAEPAAAARADAVDRHGAGHGSPMNSAMTHVGAACLAVLSATLAALVAVAIALAIASSDPAPRSSTPRWAQRLGPLRPPDIFSLCVLRT